MTQLLAEAGGGSIDAMGALFQRFRPYLLQYANVHIERDLQAKAGGSDLVQQTFLEAQRDFPQFRGTSEAELLAWLRGILQNNIANFIRHFRETEMRQVGREQPLGRDGSSEFQGEPAAPHADPAGRLEQRDHLERAIDRLPAEYREVIVQHSRLGRPFAAIAAETGRSAEAVRKMWGRAVIRLQALMDDNP